MALRALFYPDRPSVGVAVNSLSAAATQSRCSFDARGRARAGQFED